MWNFFYLLDNFVLHYVILRLILCVVSSDTCMWAEAIIQVQSRRAMILFVWHNKAHLSLVYINTQVALGKHPSVSSSCVFCTFFPSFENMVCDRTRVICARTFNSLAAIYYLCMFPFREWNNTRSCLLVKALCPVVEEVNVILWRANFWLLTQTKLNTVINSPLNNIGMLLLFLETVLDTTDRKCCIRANKICNNECIKGRSELTVLPSLCSGCWRDLKKTCPL